MLNYLKYENYQSERELLKDTLDATAMGWTPYEVYMQSTNEYFLWWMPHDDDLEENIDGWNSDPTNAPITEWNVA